MHRDPLIRSFDRLAARRPERALVVSPGRSATVADVDAHARAIEERLVAASLPAGVPLGLRLPNGPLFLAALVAALRTGHAPVLLDAQATDAECHRALERLRTCGLLVGAPARAAGSDAVTLARRTGGRPLETAGEVAAVIKLSSGSTGEPCGILTPTTALLADERALAASMAIAEEDVLLASVPMSHSYGLSSLAVPALVRGTTIAVPAPGDRFAPLAAAAGAGATVFPTVPAYLAGLLRLAVPPALPPTLRLVIAAGSRLLPETAAAFRGRYGLPVHVFYGASECGGITYDREGGAAERGEVGEPVEGVTVELEPLSGLDPASGRRVVVRSPAVAESYLPEPDPRLARGRFESDDLGRFRGRGLELAGRIGETINVRGRKVNPVEVERVIAELEAVSDVRVMGVPRDGSGDESIRAVVACASGAVTPESVVRWCRERLSEFKVPRRIVIVDRLPCTARGKPDRQLLRRLVTATPGDDRAEH